MKKICHVTTVHPSRYDVRIYEKECSSLATEGFDVTLIVNDSLPNEENNRVKILSINKKPKNRFDRVKRIADCALKKALEVDADIYHIHDPELLPIAIKLKRKGKIVIFDSHEFTALQIMSKTYIPKILRKTVSRCYRKYEIHTLNRLDGLIYPCTINGNEYFSDVKISKVLIGNYPSIKLLDNNYFGDSLDDREPKACYVGAMEETRGILQMIKGCAEAGRKIVLIGDISPELMCKIEKMPEFSFVEYKGKLSHEAALNEMAKCSVGLSLLQNQGQYAYLDNLPTKMYEYMCVGLPIVFSDFPFYNKLAEKYSFGIPVNPSNTHEIANAINMIIENHELGYTFIENGRKMIREEMNWEIDAMKLIDFYREIGK